ncbi:MAG TPA: MFS transporter [Gemmatimonadales bacterium]|nr:MFS transporter [Gemmatimonadales bacterium]
MTGPATAALPLPPTRAYAWYALGLLTVINLLNYLDRNVIFALFEPIKAELALSDAQLGWLGSAYVLVFSLAALPFGVMSDLRSRRAVIAFGVACWSLFTVLSGMVESYAQLFICRAAVGIGEAAFGAAAASLVADYFAKRGRAVAMGILAAGLVVGGGLGIWLGGKLGEAYGWRIAFMVVGAPGFVCAALAARLRDPTRHHPPIILRPYFREMRDQGLSLFRQFLPTIVGLVLGGAAALVLDRRFGATSRIDAAAFAIVAGIGIALNIWVWVHQIRRNRIDETPFGGEMTGAIEGMLGSARAVLGTPTLVYIFIGGALISFGMNGLVGWAPTFVSRSLGMSAAEASDLLGWRLLLFGALGTLAGGGIADWLRTRTEAARVITISTGMLIGGALATGLLLSRDVALFGPLFAGAVFFLTWYNGPIVASIFDVVPARIGATVAGTYYLFIHLVGDAVALPLVGGLSDRFGIDRAVLLLPAAGMLGGAVIVLAVKTVRRDMARVATDGTINGRGA